VVGLGPGPLDLIGVGARERIERVERRFVRTWRHPSATAVGDAVSFDDLYDRAEVIDEVYPAMVEALVAAARAASQGEVIYAVPGSPLVAERTVELLRADHRVRTEVIAALSFVDLVWARLGVDPFAEGVRLVDGHRFVTGAAGSVGPLLVSQCDSYQVLSHIKLALDDGPDVVVLRRLGMADEAVDIVSWADLDRRVEPDHLTCLWIPRLAEPVAAEMARVDALVRTLRVACPWDKSQSHASLTRHLVEEAYEVVEALDEVTAATESGTWCGPAYEHLEEELGDLLFQIAFHAVIAAEAGYFGLSEVAAGIHDKLVARHPQVFAPGAGGDLDPGVAVAGWELAKQAEKGRTSIMDGIPAALPALLVAAKVGAKAASVGFDWEDLSGVWAKVDEELAELHAEIESARPFPSAVERGHGDRVFEELGDVIFTVTSLARHLRIDPEAALRAANAKFRKRFAAMEEATAGAGGDLPGLDARGWERLWVAARAARP